MNSDENLSIRPVEGLRDWKAFHAIRHTIYRRDRAAVRPLRIQERAALDRTHHPFYQHAEVQPFLAWRGRHPIGRVVAIHDRLHQQYYTDRVGFFGFFEVPDDHAVAHGLLAAAQEWLGERGCQTLRGPMNPSLKGEFGVLVHGHQHPPSVMMGHSPAYYEGILQADGFSPIKSFFAFRLSSEMIRRQGGVGDVSWTMHRQSELKVRSADARHLDDELRRINALANRVRNQGWGFVPFTEAELDHLIFQLRGVLDPRLLVLAERRGNLVGYVMVIPDLNWALRHTVGTADAVRLPQLLYWKRRIPRARVLAIGADRHQGGVGVTALLLREIIDRALPSFREFEISWIAEDNTRSLNLLRRFCPEPPHKIYRLYDRPMPR